jgi:hypothetical protein
VITLGRGHVRAFEAWAREGFEAEMAAHCREFSPHLCRTLDEDHLRVAIRQAIDRAATHGLCTRGSARLFIDLSLLFGSGFASDPQYPWAAAVLSRDDLADPMHRAETLHEQACAYLRQVGGVDNEHTRAALERLAAAADHELDVRAESFTPDVLRLLKRLHPEKYEYTGAAPLEELITAADVQARLDHGFTVPRARLVLAVLMFAFGHACDQDPLYPWIARTLEPTAPGDRNDRAAKLERRARIWLRAVLKNQVTP